LQTEQFHDNALCKGNPRSIVMYTEALCYVILLAVGLTDPRILDSLTDILLNDAISATKNTSLFQLRVTILVVSTFINVSHRITGLTDVHIHNLFSTQFV